MRSLLDTHTFLWFVAGDDRLSVRARTRIEARDSEILLSIASIWEIAIKAALGRLPLPMSVRSFVPRAGGGCRYAIVIERGPTSYGTYVPDLPGCAAVAKTEAKARKLIREGIHIHLEEMRCDGEPIPEPTSRIASVDVAQAASVA